MKKNLHHLSFFVLIASCFISCEKKTEDTLQNSATQNVKCDIIIWPKDVTPSGKVIAKSYPAALFTFQNHGIVYSSGYITLKCNGKSSFNLRSFRYNLNPNQYINKYSSYNTSSLSINKPITLTILYHDDFNNINYEAIRFQDTQVTNPFIIYESDIYDTESGLYRMGLYPKRNHKIVPRILNNSSISYDSIQISSVTVEKGGNYVENLNFTGPLKYGYSKTSQAIYPSDFFTISIKEFAPENTEIVLGYTFSGGFKQSIRYLVLK